MIGIDSLICAKHQTRNLTIRVRISIDTIFHLSIHYPVVVSMYSSCWRERSELRRRLRGFRGAETAALSIMSPHGTDNSTAAPSLCLVICRGFDFLHPLDGGCSSAAEQLQKAQTKVITFRGTLLVSAPSDVTSHVARYARNVRNRPKRAESEKR